MVFAKDMLPHYYVATSQKREQPDFKCDILPPIAFIAVHKDVGAVVFAELSSKGLGGLSILSLVAVRSSAIHCTLHFILNWTEKVNLQTFLFNIHLDAFRQNMLYFLHL